MKATALLPGATLLMALLLGCGALVPLAGGQPNPNSQGTASPLSGQSGSLQRGIELPVRSSSVTVVSALPAASKGLDVKDFQDFPSSSLTAAGGRVRLDLGREPLYVLDGDTSVASLDVINSPFGAHSALVLDPSAPFAAAQQLGIRWHRGIYAYWIKVQPGEDDIRRGIFHWEDTDREWGAVPKDMAILANIGLPERLQGGLGPPPLSFPPSWEWKLNQPEDAYLAFVRAAVERYDGDGYNDMPGLSVPVKTWQFENEPDGWNNRDWEGYARLQEITYQAIKQACPEARVLIGGQTGLSAQDHQRFFEPALKKLGGKSVDIFDFHWYGNALLDWKDLEVQIRDTRARLDRLGYSKTPIWITETGTYSGTPGDEATPSLVGAPPAPVCPPQSEREQARDLVKRFTFALGLGVQKVFWAFGVMEGFQQDDGYFDHTGLIYDGHFDNDPPRGTPKLAFYAYGKMTRVLEGADWSQVRRLDLGADVYAFVVPRGAGTVTVLWHDPRY